MIFGSSGSKFNLDERRNIQHAAFNTGEIHFNRFIANRVVITDLGKLTKIDKDFSTL